MRLSMNVAASSTSKSVPPDRPGNLRYPKFRGPREAGPTLRFILIRPLFLSPLRVLKARPRARIFLAFIPEIPARETVRARIFDLQFIDNMLICINF